MAFTEGSPVPESEFHIFVSQINTFRDMLSSADFGTTIHHDMQLAASIELELSQIRVSDISKIRWMPREIRPRDGELSIGEHAGVEVAIDLHDGSTIMMHIKGGLRDPKAGSELSDGNGQYARERHHRSRTDQIVEKPTEYNLHFIHPTYGKTVDIWLRDSPGAQKSVSVYIMNQLGRKSSVMEQHEDIIVFRANLPDQEYYYKAFHAALQTFSDSVLRLFG